MTRQELLLAILAAADGRAFTPVQIQKAAFLITTNIPEAVDEGPSYQFRPYDYGPFDSSVYSDAEALRRAGQVEITNVAGVRWNRYAACDDGLAEGRALLAQLPERTRNYIESVSSWVRDLTFEQLVKSIYDAYPAMRANSIFRD